MQLILISVIYSLRLWKSYIFCIFFSAGYDSMTKKLATRSQFFFSVILLSFQNYENWKPISSEALPLEEISR